MCSVTDSFKLDALIKPNELLTSSALIARCVDRGFDKTHARQLVRRGATRNGIWRSEKLSLQSNGRLFAHKEFKETSDFIDKLLRILSKERPGLYRVAQKLSQENVILRANAHLLLASPNDPKKAPYPSYESEVAALEEVGLCKVDARGTGAERLVAPRVSGTSTSSAAALTAQTKLLIAESLASILIDHFRYQNFVSWNTIAAGEPRESLVLFNNYLFSAVTFTWLSPLLRWEEGKKKPKPTPVIFHIDSSRCTKLDVDAFLTRMERAGVNKTSKLKVLGVMAAGDFEEEAWKAAKRSGLMTINLKQLFGDAAFEAIVKVQELLKNVAGDPKRTNAEEYQNLSNALEKLGTNPFIADLKSLAFESLSALLIKYEGWEEVSLNLKVPLSLPEGATEREVDVSAQKNAWDDVCLIECKAEEHDKPLAGEYVRKFFTQTVPAFLKVKCPNHNPSRCRAEIWTTGIVSDDVRDVLDRLHLAGFIEAALMGKDEIIAMLPKPLESTARLIRTISQQGAGLSVAVERREGSAN